MIFNYKTINYDDKLYYVYREIYEDDIKPGMVSELKDFLFCDLVLKNKKDNRGVLLFLREISDAEIIEEIID